MPSCKCGRRFGDSHALQQHREATSHHYCLECAQAFVDANAVQQHRSAVHSFICKHCGRKFPQLQPLYDHQKSTQHCYCRECDRHFVSSEALRQHSSSAIHATQFHCCDCDRDFVHEQALIQHLADKYHNPRAKSSIQTSLTSSWVCGDCDREFRDEKRLQQHRSSVIHAPLCNIKCIGSNRCTQVFTSPSACLHHLESGACPSNLTAEKLHMAIQSSDTHQLITKVGIHEDAALMRIDVSEEMSATESTILTPVSDNHDSGPPWPSDIGSPSGILTPSSQSISEDLSIATTLSCPLCPTRRRVFNSFNALQDHLSSPAHSPKVFHCPVFLIPNENRGKASGLLRNFSTLSGLMQHLESGACQGGDETFRKAVAYVEDSLRKMGFRNWSLLR